MTASASSAARRALLSFSVDQLSPRDELLLKSFVRVLDHRTHQHWNCVDSQGDLRVTGQPDGAPGACSSGPVLCIGQAAREGAYALTLPLHAEQLEAVLNRIGDAIVQARGTEAPAGAGTIRDDEEFRLRRWPQAALLNSGHRVTLATLMSARPYTLPLLHRQSGVPLKVCGEFLQDLRQAGLLHGTPAPAHTARGERVADASVPGAPTTVQSSNDVQRRVHAPAPQPGLLARIRARFGLQPAWPR
ncbi:MAG: hypothetical protein JSR41_05895 [Proteobacteria bacterium]|nr:hypothetical protein [Pseudomonadota bacterium]